MIDHNQIKNKLENIFNKYKFTTEQRSQVFSDLIQTGELLVFSKLAIDMTVGQKKEFEQHTTSSGSLEEKTKNIYEFLSKVCGESKINEIRNSVYDKLVNDYISSMSA